MKKVYSLEKDGAEILSVEIDLPPGLNIEPTLNKTWLRSTIAEQFIRKSSRKVRGQKRPASSSRNRKRALVTA